MGHDWTAVKELNEQEEIAYLRRSMSSKTIHEFYDFLGCSQVDNGVSGAGYYIIVSLETIKEAITKVIDVDYDLEDENDYVEFLNKLQTYCKENNQKEVTIIFN